MSIEERINTLVDSNPNITDKKWFKQSLSFIKKIYSYYDVDYDFSNIIDIIKKIYIKNIDEINDSNSIRENASVYYDVKNNWIVRGSTSDDLLFDLCKTFIEISSQSYDSENNRYNRGLTVYNENGEIDKNTEDFNNYVISSIITNITHLKKENQFDTGKEIVLSNYLKKATDKIGYRELVSSLAYAKGSEFYSKMSEEEIKKGI